jgi:FkbM family methyltransferase
MPSSSVRFKRSLRALLSPKLKAHVVLAGPLRGYRLVTSWRDYPAGVMGRTERSLLAWFQREVRAGDTWLDIGAHYGYTAIALSRLVGTAGRVFAFEPVTATAGCVAQTRRLNNLRQLTVVPLGLGEPESLASVTLPLTRGMADKTFDGVDGPWLESLQIARFDWLWPIVNAGRDAVDGVKIDVQGMELDVLCGMEQLLLKHGPKLVIEFHRGVNRSAILDLLDGVGYGRRPSAIEPQAGDLSQQLLDDRSYVFEKATR